MSLKNPNQQLLANKTRIKGQQGALPITKHQSTKIIGNYNIKQIQPDGKKILRKTSLKIADENDKNEGNLFIDLNTELETDKQKTDNEEFSATSSEMAESANNVITNAISISSSKVSVFDLNNANAINKSRTFTKHSLNHENYLANISLGKINKFSKEDFKELLTKFIRNDYSNAILSSLMAEENENVGFLLHHKITERMRTRMIDWMIEVLSNYHCDNSTFFEAVNILDRYWKSCWDHRKYLEPEHLHLVGVTAMFMASKYHDIYPLRLKTVYEKIAHRKLSCEEIKAKEEEISRYLTYILGTPTVWDFISFYIEEWFYIKCNNHHITSKVLLSTYIDHDSTPRETINSEMNELFNKLYTKNMLNLLHYVCIYLGKMNCHDYNLMQKKPSLVGAGTIYVGIKICEQINKECYINDYFTCKLSEVSQKDEAEIIKTAQKIWYNAQNFDTVFNDLENLKKVHFNEIIELKVTK